MPLHTMPTDEGSSQAAATRLVTRLHAARPTIVITATDTEGQPVRVRLRDVHAALSRALPGSSINVGRDYWTGRVSRVTTFEFLAAVEQQLQDLVLRVRDLEAGRVTSTVHVTVSPPAAVAVERIQTVERDTDRLITRTKTIDVPIARTV